MRTLLMVLLAATGQPDPAASGSPRPGSASVETLPPRAGMAEIRTPQGFIRAEGSVSASRGSGTFGVYAAGTYGGHAAPPPGPGEAGAAYGPPSAPEGAVGRPPPDRCRRERNRYLRRLLRMDGIDLEDPLALLGGLAGPSVNPDALLFSAYGLLPGVDPVRPLAWDFELQGIARELAACEIGERALAR